MKLSFSTLGCPGWKYDEILAAAKDLGFQGIELRGLEREIYIPKAKPFLAANVENTIKQLKKLELEIPCLTSGSFLFDKENIENHLEEARDYIDLAQRVGVPYVRVLGDASPEAGDIDYDFVLKNAYNLCEYAENKNVKILIETNGVFADSKLLQKLLKDVNHKNIGVLWDIHHPFRYFNESPAETYSLLKDYICFVHVKDSLVKDGKVTYKMMGYGDVPVKEVVKLLDENNYDGFISLEWVKRWCLDLEEPGVVFSHFVSYMQSI